MLPLTLAYLTAAAALYVAVRRSYAAGAATSIPPSRGLLAMLALLWPLTILALLYHFVRVTISDRNH